MRMLWRDDRREALASYIDGWIARRGNLEARKAGRQIIDIKVHGFRLLTFKVERNVQNFNV
jgi:hypothetical protein